MDSDSETGSDKTSISSLGMDSDSETGSDKTSKPLYNKSTLIPRCVSTSCLGMDSDSETGSDKASKPVCNKGTLIPRRRGSLRRELLRRIIIDGRSILSGKSRSVKSMTSNLNMEMRRSFYAHADCKLKRLAVTDDSSLRRAENLIKFLRFENWEDFESLPEHIRKAILFCSLFPLDYEFDMDTMVLLWIAQGLFQPEELVRVEDVGRVCFKMLLNNKFILLSGFDSRVGQEMYKVNNAMTYFSYLEEALAGAYMKVEEEGKLSDISKETLHLSLRSNNFDFAIFDVLKNCKQLCTLILLSGYGSSINQVPFDLFLILKQLRTLDLSRTHISELPNSVGNLLELRYLDLSETPIADLPTTIDCLNCLQTLRLRGCLCLIGLPKGMKKLTNLRHLDLDIVRQCKSMPPGMGNLTNLQTLRAFLVGRDDGCRIGELKNMNNLSGSFCILGLQNVLNSEEARAAALNNKQYLKKLELRWGDHQNDQTQAEEEILECLQPHFGLKELQILFYNGSRLPRWISNPSFADIIDITLYGCINCYLLPSIGALPSLKFLKLIEMNGVKDISSTFCRIERNQGYHAFPKLEKLTIDVMLNLEEWTGVENGDFPCLLEFRISYCPKLSALPLLSHLTSLKHLQISHCGELQALPDEGMPASLEFLILRDCPKIKERCRKCEGQDWLKIAHVPSIWIDHQEISSNQGCDSGF
ncbi:unnamed protein product [Ilex paraguariensis]|uniref:Uncharacterized protein n=1 Tax=Ilex paraguariensis TaxID=185542 RepID=A0ABC8TI67_9AQUA